LVGLGGLVAGGGALIGTGAFTTVEAERTVNISTAGDGSAFLGLEPARAGGNFVDNSTDNTIAINLDGTDSNNGNASGLNENARTRFERLVDITNNGTQDITTIEFEIAETALGDDASKDHEEAFKIATGEDTLNPKDGSPVDLFDDSSDVNGPLTPGNVVTFGVEIDLLDPDISAIDSNAEFDLTIRAETTNSNN
jgi:hypothetical protein